MVYKSYMKRAPRITLGVLDVALFGIDTNIASNALPSGWKPYLWISWPALGVLLSFQIASQLISHRAESLNRREPDDTRKRFIKRVEDNCKSIRKGKKSLLDQVCFKLDLDISSEGRPPNSEHISDNADDSLLNLPADAHIKDAFDFFERIVIVGAPGSGKTTMLLELAQSLLREAKESEDRPIPVVLPLSTWTTRQDSIEDWITSTLAADSFGMPWSFSSDLARRGNLIPLFDGLDEVPERLREKCMENIRQYLNSRTVTRSVLCCRQEEYEILKARLKFNGVVKIQPLARGEVNSFLCDSDPRIEGLRAALASDPELWNLAKSPLLLSFMAFAYEDGYTESAGDQPGDGRHKLYTEYVQKALQWRKSKRYSARKSQIYLTALAKNLNNHDYTVFTLDLLDHSWLDPLDHPWPSETTHRQWQAKVTAALASGLIMFCVSTAYFNWQVSAGVFGLTVTVAAISTLIMGGSLGLETIGVDRYYLIQSSRQPGLGAWIGNLVFGGTDSLDYMPPRLLLILLTNVPIGIIIALKDSPEIAAASTYALSVALYFALSSTETALFVAYEITGGVHPVRGEVPSPRIRARLVFSIRVAMVTGVTSWAIVAVLGKVAPMQDLTPTKLGFLAGTLAGILPVTSVAGEAIIEQFLTRWDLQRADIIPWPCVPFLDYMTECLLLYRTEQGYSFIHKELMDFMASFPTESEAET
jgi:hypothetical protein